MITDFEDAFCDATRAALSEELATVTPAVSLSIFGEDRDLAEHRIEINASCTTGGHLPGEAYRYGAIRNCQLSLLFATVKIPASRPYVSAVKNAMRHVVETAWESDSPVAGLLAQRGIQIHPAPQQIVHQQEELGEGNVSFICVRMEYAITFFFDPNHLSP